ncbi:biotin/lipoate--protein ligase family protein [Mesorhizobium sp. 10J20-29]
MTVAELTAPVFPPAFDGHAVDPEHDLLAEALSGAAAGTYGAGDLIWSRSTDRAAAMIVLEPDVPLSRAVQMGPTLMVAIGDALGAIGPPNLALTFRWPFTVLANGGRIGRVVLAAPENAALEVVPSFLIVGFELALKNADNGADEPGRHPDMTALHEEGGGEIERTELVEAVARHFLSWIDGWQQEGFRGVHQSWLARAHDMNGPVEGRLASFFWSGQMLGLDEEGGLLVSENGVTSAIPVAAALEGLR